MLALGFQYNYRHCDFVIKLFCYKIIFAGGHLGFSRIRQIGMT